MPECLPDLPRYVLQQGGQWYGADSQSGPWRPIPAPQSGLPWKTDGPAPATITPADRLALALCRVIDPATGTCATGEVCRCCRRDAAAVVRELVEQAGSAKHWHVDQLSALAAELEVPHG